MSEKKSERIAGTAWNTIQFLKKKLEKLREAFKEWQLELFNPGKPLSKYFHDQINFNTGMIFKYGGVPNQEPIGRIDMSIQREAIEKQREVDKIVMEIGDVFDRVAHKLSIVKKQTVYASQIDVNTGELKDLPKGTKCIEINIDEDDEITAQAAEKQNTKQEEVAAMFDDAGGDEPE